MGSCHVGRRYRSDCRSFGSEPPLTTHVTPDRGRTPVHPTSRGGLRFVVATFCAMVAMVSYFDRVVLSLDIEPIQNEFDLGDASFGLLM